MTPSRILLGIDAGGSSTKWEARLEQAGPVLNDHALDVTGQAGPLSAIHFLNPAARARAEHTLEEIVLEAISLLDTGNGNGTTLTLVATIGLTGLSEGSSLKTEVENAFHSMSPIPIERLDIYNDVELAYRGCLTPGEGVVIYAGTGSIAVHLDKDETMHRAGGFGFLIDDAGGGYWLGREALAWFLRTVDTEGTTPKDPLASALIEAMGHEHWPQIKEWVYEGGRERVATLARVVIDAAPNSKAATLLVERAARELIELAGRLQAARACSRWVFAGGLFRGDNAIRRAIFEACEAPKEIGFGPASFASAAVELARRGTQQKTR